MVLLTFPPRRTPRGVGGLTGLRPLPPTPKKEKFPCQEKCSRVPNRFLFKNKRNFTGALICSRVPSRFLFKNKRNFTVAPIMKHWQRDFEENFGIPLIYTRSTRFSSNFDTFRTDFHPKMASKDVEKAFRELRELHRRSREPRSELSRAGCSGLADPGSHLIHFGTPAPPAYVLLNTLLSTIISTIVLSLRWFS